MGRKRKAEISQEGDDQSEKDFENGHNNCIINSKKVKPNNKTVVNKLQTFTTDTQKPTVVHSSPLPDLSSLNEVPATKSMQPSFSNAGSSQAAIDETQKSIEPKKKGRTKKMLEDTKVTENVECVSIRYKGDEFHPNYKLNNRVDTIPLESVFGWQEFLYKQDVSSFSF
jgi:hypothetical protein